MQKPVLKEQMAKKLYSVRPTTPIKEAFLFMEEKRVRHLLVVDPDGLVCGLISDRDFKRAAKTNVEKLPSLTILGEHFAASDLVEDYMSWDVLSLDQETPLKEVAYLMLKEKISSVVTTDQNKNVTGLITTTDLIWVLIKLLEDQEDSLIENLKAEIMNSPLGAVAQSLSQAGI